MNHKGLLTRKGQVSDIQTDKNGSWLQEDISFAAERKYLENTGMHTTAELQFSNMLYARFSDIDLISKKQKCGFAVFALQYTIEVSVLLRSLSLSNKLVDQ